MHDIGKLVVCMVLPDEFSNIVKKAGKGNLELYPFEQQILGITHDDIGARLVKRWMLPIDLITAVEYHHRPAGAPTQTAFPMVIHLADVLAHDATAMRAPDNTQTGKGLFPPDIINSAKSRGIQIHQETVEGFSTELEVQMEAQAGILEIFLS
jgi:HD-like signal output (HDOD) protein